MSRLTSQSREKIFAVFVGQDHKPFDSSFQSRIQSLGIDECILVINGTDEGCSLKFSNIHCIHTYSNLGGAGGFNLGISRARELGASWIWTSDDDAFPVKNYSVKCLVDFCKLNNVDVCGSLIIDPSNFSESSFPFRVNGKRTWDVQVISKENFIPYQAHLFNGTVFKSDVFSIIGLPDSGFFIRGDEVDIILKLKKLKIRFGTWTGAHVIHPSGKGELVPIFFGLLNAVVPYSALKYSYQVRNRGLLAIRHRRLDWVIFDSIRFLLFFKFRVFSRGCRMTFSIYLRGIFGESGEVKILSEDIWKEIEILRN